MITWFGNGKFATEITRIVAVGFLHVKSSLIEMSVNWPIYKEEITVLVFYISNS